MKKILPYIIIFLVVVELFRPGIAIKVQADPVLTPGATGLPASTTIPQPSSPTGNTSGTTTTSSTKYKYLQPLPDPDHPGKNAPDFDPTTTASLSIYLNLIIKLFLGICGVLAVIMIVIGGMEYMTSELISNKEQARSRITNAILGLLLALSAWAILNTINPDLLKSDPKSLTQATLTITQFIVMKPDGTTASTAGGAPPANLVGTVCDPKTLLQTAQSIGQPLSIKQAGTLACVAGPESSCGQNLQNYSWGTINPATGKASTAYGPFQILLASNSTYFDNPICSAAAGVTGPLNCKNGFDSNGLPLAGQSQLIATCQKAAANTSCSLAAAIKLMNVQGFSAWTADPNNSAQAACIASYS